GHQPQPDLTHRGQVPRPEEVGEGGVYLVAPVDVAVAHPLAQRLGRYVDELDHVRAVEHTIGHRFADGDPGDLLDQVLDALEVLDVDGGDHVDPGVPEVLDVPPALVVAQAGSVRVRELVDQGDLGPARQDRVEIHVLQGRAAVLHLHPWHHLQALQKLDCPRPPIGLDEGHDHVVAMAQQFVRLAQHGEGFAGPGRRAEVDLQLPPGRSITGRVISRYRPAPLSGGWLCRYPASPLSSARFTSSTLTRGSPNIPRMRPWTCRSTSAP